MNRNKTSRNNTLSNVLKRAKKRKTVRNKSGKEITWYKRSRDGKCPDKDDDNNTFNAYWSHFGCFPHSNRIDRERKGKDAMQCAAERLADGKNVLLRKEPFDINHVYPIKLAYDMGKVCLKDTLYYDSYVEKFRNYYTELIQGHPDVHNLFQSKYGIGDYPLDHDFKEIQNGIEWKINQNKSYTPTIFENYESNNSTNRTDTTIQP